MKSRFKVQRLNGEWEMKLKRDKTNETTKKRVIRYTHVLLLYWYGIQPLIPVTDTEQQTICTY